jgi:hypothetical protein
MLDLPKLSYPEDQTNLLFIAQTVSTLGLPCVPRW